MIEYRKGNLLIISDFEIRPLREEGPDIDLFIPIDYRTLNLNMEDMPDYIYDRIQLLGIRSLLIRHSIEGDNSFSTIHFLRNVDLKSAVMNFIFNCKDHFIQLIDQESSMEMIMTQKYMK